MQQNDVIARERLITSLKRQPCKLINGKAYVRMEAVLEKVRCAPSVNCRRCVQTGKED